MIPDHSGFYIAKHLNKDSHGYIVVHVYVILEKVTVCGVSEPYSLSEFEFYGEVVMPGIVYNDKGDTVSMNEC